MDYHTKIMTHLSDNNTHEALKPDQATTKRKLSGAFKNLKGPTYHRLYPGEAIPCIYGLPKTKSDPLLGVNSELSVHVYKSL